MNNGFGGFEELSERKKAILKAVIDAHIENGEPVGSKFLTQNKQIGCSSATVRNEMAELEAMGLLEQPHTSAGRVPSEAGYRFYVNSLIDRYNLTQTEIEELKSSLTEKQNELDAIMQAAVELASRLTNYTALSIKPRRTRITVRKFELMRLDDSTAVLIMLIGDSVKTKYIYSDKPIPDAGAAALANLLNSEVVGKTPSEMTVPLVMEMEKMLGDYGYLVSPVIKAVCETLSDGENGDIHLEGINRLLSYPEYYDMDRLRDMLALFEQKDDLYEMLADEAQSGDGVHIYIGRENLVKVMDNSTLVFKPIVDHGRTVGAIGIIGPTRMDYKRVLATIDSLTSGITDALGRALPGGKHDNDK